jgi:hypothetical protein
MLSALWLGITPWSAGFDGKAGAKPVLEIKSLDPTDCTLALSFPWGAMAVNHVIFNDHRGPFKATVQSSGKGVRVTFDGWGEEPFVASADKVRIIYRVAGRKGFDFVAEGISGRAVRVRPVDRPISQGKRIVIGFGERDATGPAKVSVEANSD